MCTALGAGGARGEQTAAHPGRGRGVVQILKIFNIAVKGISHTNISVKASPERALNSARALTKLGPAPRVAKFTESHEDVPTMVSNRPTAIDLGCD
ncbi:hypothetical protein EVAR_94710_1 [Eumeta japonica]|uniref:Uncharacterized protein n=1 Tax=Eumeta variegata TaxID=151549 RepID=A0A4C1UWC2_EUMVA|nr:hypothetical protein EVAR_94710_1 [Eumeta japonica]